MLYLIEYDRSHGAVVNITSFNAASREEAEDARLNLELELNRRGVQREVVLLEATSEDALRLTHRRYFDNLADLARSSASSTAG